MPISEWGQTVIDNVSSSATKPADTFYRNKAGDKVYPFRDGYQQDAPLNDGSPAAGSAPAPDLFGLGRAPAPVDIKDQQFDAAPSDPEIDAAEAEEKIDFLPAAAASFRVDNSGYSLYQEFTDPRFYYDSAFSGADYVKNPEVAARIDALTMADTEEVYENLGAAYNQDHAEFLMARFEEKQADELALASGGGKALTARLGANILDPVDIGVTLATAGTVGAGVKAAKVGRILTAAGSAGLSNAAVEAVVARENPFRDETDIAFAGAAGLIMGGSLSWLTRGENLTAEQLATRRANEILREAARQPDTAGAARRVLDGEDEKPADNLAPKSEELLDDVLENAEVPDYKYGLMDKLTMNLRGKITDGSAEGRRLFNVMFEGGFLKDKSKTRSFTAEGRQRMIDESLSVKFMARTDQHFKSWSKDNGYSNLQADIGLEAGEKFYREVADATRGIDDPSISAHAKAAAAEQANVYREVYEMAQRHGVKGFEGEPLDNFFPRLYDKQRFNSVLRRLGRDNNEGEVKLRQFFREAILSGQDDITETLAETFARSMVRTLRRSSSNIDQQFTHGIPLDDLDRLREVLTDGLVEGSDDWAAAIKDVDAIAKELDRIKAAKGSETGKVDRAKRRVRLDEGFKDFIKDRDGTPFELKFTDLLHNDARAVGMRYIQVMAGHIGLASEAGIKSTTDFDNVIKGVTSRNENAQIDPGQTSREVDALRRGYKLLTGQSVEADPMGAASKLSRTIRDVNFARSSGSFGVAQLAEYGNLMAVGVFRAFGRHIPELQNLNRRALDGTLENPVARQIEEWFGAGGDFIRNPAIRGFDEFGEGFEGTDRLSKNLAGMDPTIQVAKRAASVLSLMAPIVARMEKQASIAHVWEWTDNLLKGKSALSDAKAARWRGAGLTDEMQARVFEQMKNVEFDSAGRIKNMHVDKWDPEVADSFAMALRRQAAFTIQRNDLADVPEPMRGPLGRLVLQFKAFMFGSIVKQLERGIHYRDIETSVAFMSSMFFAGTAYTAQTYLETIGDPETRKEKLSPQQIAGAAFSRAGWTALLVPPAATFAELMGWENVFNHRYSGLQASFLSLDQNPTTQLIGSALGTTQAVTTDLLSGDTRRFDRKDAQRALNLFPYNRVLGIKNALHLVEE